MKKFLKGICSVLMIVVGGYLIYHGMIQPLINNDKEIVEFDDFLKQELSPGEIFETGKYINVEGVEILYNGKTFLVTNNRADMVRITCKIVGVKKDGTYDTIQVPSFGGPDETLYEREKAENGWAIKKATNLIRPSETLDATLDIFDFNNFDSEYPENDIDNDGFVDILFMISPQKDEKSIMVSTNDIESKIYKIKSE